MEIDEVEDGRVAGEGSVVRQKGNERLEEQKDSGEELRGLLAMESEFCVMMSDFVCQKLRGALGKDSYRDFLPVRVRNQTRAEIRMTSDELQQVLSKRWISAFSDSPLDVRGIREAVDELRELNKLARTMATPTAAQLNSARQITALMIAAVRPHVSSSQPQPQPRPTSQETTQTSTASTARTRDHSSMDVDIVYGDEHAPAPATNEGSTSAAVSAENTAIAGLPRVFVLDGPNVAWRHGLNERFSWVGILHAVEFLEWHRCVAIAFVPETRYGVRGSAVDDHQARQRVTELIRRGAIVLTPQADYDDCYIISFARSRGAIVISNDRFQDHVTQASADGQHASERLQKWLDQCRLSFTFHGDEFLPNPSFDLDRGFEYARREVGS
eukprot:CAMPEP_0185856658 /NCGR_PEP_ID=MMETSP1354-20130828/29112_1 /TAXON_ID=708628 /ORGANISM="Erythrolobus madagascarensis, Strain CCMP3276" /LENGTH=384 /DNA_ID=CAMNT_0028558919 /DNA_START=1250 /DNA_END=2404 /DNA_ORIENTATION=+